MSQIMSSDQASGPSKAEILPATNNTSHSGKQAGIDRGANGWRSPDRKTSDTLWLIIVVSFAIVLVGTFLSLAIGVLILGKSDANAELQILLTMFTAVVAFLAGLLIPGPTSAGQSTGQ
jgi:hypothetical protein